jgi:hypothetical protein
MAGRADNNFELMKDNLFVAKHELTEVDKTLTHAIRSKKT